MLKLVISMMMAMLTNWINAIRLNMLLVSSLIAVLLSNFEICSKQRQMIPLMMTMATEEPIVMAF